MLESALLGKTFLILSLQLFITFLACFGLILFFRSMYHKGVSWIQASTNEKGQLDLHVSWKSVRPFWWITLILFIIVFFILLAVQTNIMLAMIVFSIWSVITGILVGFSLISVDENLGSKVLAITASITFITGLIGLYSGIDFSFMGKGLLIALIILLIINIIRLFVRIDGMLRKIIAGFGAVLFTLYLIYDFNKIANGEDTWYNALDISIDIYLDIINLFLYLLDLMSN